MEKKFWYLKGVGLLVRASVREDGSLSDPQIYNHSKKRWVKDKEGDLFRCLSSGDPNISAEPLYDNHEIHYLEQIENIALRFATDAHAGQFDEDGVPFINHPINVASRLDTPLKKAIAYLHDVVEDTDYTVEDIKKAFGTEVSERVWLLTNDCECDYVDDYLWYIADDPIATEVKLADLAHNLERDYAHDPEKRNLERIRKHEGGVFFLEGYKEMNEEDDIPSGNDFDRIGFTLNCDEDWEELFSANEELVTDKEFNEEKYSILKSDGSEIWKYNLDSEPYFVPFYDSGKSDELLFEDWNKDEARALPCFIEAEVHKDTPFVFTVEALNIFEFMDRDFSVPCKAALMCFARDVTLYSSEAEYKKDYPKFAVESFFVEPDKDGEIQPEAYINGIVGKSEIIRNNYTGEDFIHFTIQCNGFEFECVGDKYLFAISDDSELGYHFTYPNPGDIVHGRFGMVAKIL